MTDETVVVEQLQDDLRFIERWANHHANKPGITAAQALSVIQHYPAIAEITRGYADGQVPDTFNPFAEIERLTTELAGAYELLHRTEDEKGVLRKALERVADYDAPDVQHLIQIARGALAEATALATAL